jgi:2-polyprenyl-3-methyl-5-hydroxy-6-metoxy-1,4-benzoquinol methylase
MEGVVVKITEGKILFEGERNGVAFLFAFLSFAICLTIMINVIQSYVFPIGSESIIFLIGFLLVLGPLLVYGVVYGIGFYTSKRRVRFVLNEDSGELSLFVAGKLKMKTNNYSYSTALNRMHRLLFFHFSITDENKYITKDYYERVDSRLRMDGITIDPDYIRHNLIPRTPDRYPSFISDTWKMLKEFDKNNESRETFSPFVESDSANDQKAESANLKRWNELVDIHSRSKMYNLDEFRKNPDYLALDDIEKTAFDSVNGKELLHLQCHFGLSTMSFERMGASVTGIDFSDKAIDKAIMIAHELSMNARFICSNLFDIHQDLTGQFDCIFTSYGVLCWLKDLLAWGRIISDFLKPGGQFFIVEFHPFAGIFDDESQELQTRYPYFSDGTPSHYQNDFSYADDTKIHNVDSFEWTHDLDEIMNSILSAGLVIREFKEYRHSCYKMLPFMKRVRSREYRIKGDPIPLMFSIKAEKPLD